MSGPPKAPSHLRLVRGNPSKRPITKGTQAPPVKGGKTPAFLSKNEQNWYKKIINQLIEREILTELDLKAVEMLVKAYSDYRTINSVLESDGIIQKVVTTTGDTRTKPSPFLGEAREARKELKAWLQEFGMTPASRSKVNVNEAETIDPFAALLSKRED